jgi:hypothetical protein
MDRAATALLLLSTGGAAWGRTPAALDASRVRARKGGVERVEGVDDVGALL